MGLCKRLVARLDIKGNRLIKGIRFEGLRVLGDPLQAANEYSREGIDEILYMDVVASLYERNTITKYIKDAAKNIFVPLTVGGGLRNLDDIKDVLNSGADKVAINTAAVKDPNLIKKASSEIGSQSIIVSIEAKKIQDNKWVVYYDYGRENSGLDVIEWAKISQSLGAGELLVTSIDQEGLKKGMDINLIKELRQVVNIPIIFGGGVGKVKDINDVLPYSDGVAIASVLHYNDLGIRDIKKGIC